MPTDQEKVQVANQKRDLLQGQLRDRMRKSIAEQGAWGVRQTTMWAKKYRLAQLCIGRENATLKTIKKRIKELDDVANWEVPL